MFGFENGSNLDVFIVEYNYDDIYGAFNDIKDGDEVVWSWQHEDVADGKTILYRNSKSYFALGNQMIENKQFDTFLYSPENDRLVMLMRGGSATADDLIKVLDERNINFHEVTFNVPSDESYYQDDSEQPEFWTARDASLVHEFVQDSAQNKNSKNAIYFPNIKGSIVLSYEGNNNVMYPIEGRVIDGIIHMEDKTILLFKTKGQKIEEGQVIGILNKFDVNYTVSEEVTLPDLKGTNFGHK